MVIPAGVHIQNKEEKSKLKALQGVVDSEEFPWKRKAVYFLGSIKNPTVVNLSLNHFASSST
jgi:hypothetical protein